MDNSALGLCAEGGGWGLGQQPVVSAKEVFLGKGQVSRLYLDMGVGLPSVALWGLALQDDSKAFLPPCPSPPTPV